MSNIIHIRPIYTVLSFIEMGQKLLQVADVQYLLSERFSQDPLEEYFGHQRGRGGRSNNPTVQTFLHNNQALTTMKTISSIGPVSKGNTRGRRTQLDIDQLSLPLLKRKRHT